MPSACRTVQAAPKEVNGKCIFSIILNILGSILMSQRQAIVAFPQRQIQLVTGENNHCCKPTISPPPPPPPSALPNPGDENTRVLSQLKKQMGKGESFRAIKHRNTVAAAFPFIHCELPSWKLLLIFTWPTETCQRHLRLEKRLISLFSLYSSLHKGWIKPCRGIFVWGSPAASTQAHWNLGGLHRLHWGVFSFSWIHSQTGVEKLEIEAQLEVEVPGLFPRTCSWLVVILQLRHFLRWSQDLVLWNYNCCLLVSLYTSVFRTPSLFLQLKCAI